MRFVHELLLSLPEGERPQLHRKRLTLSLEEVNCDDSRTYPPESISHNLVYTDIVI